MRRLTLAIMAAAFAWRALPAAAMRRPTPVPSPTPTAVATPTPQPASAAQRVALLQSRIDALGAHTAVRNSFGIAIVDLQYERHVALHGAALFPLGNVATLAIALVAYRLADQNRLRLDDRVLVTHASLRAAGPIAHFHPHGGSSYPYWELLRLMLVDDDQTARAVVLQRVGGIAAVQGVLDRLGLRSLHVATPHRSGSPDGVAALLTGIAENRFLLLDTATEYLGALALRGDSRQARIVTFSDGRRVIAVTLFAAAAGAATRETALAGVAHDVDDAFR